MGGTVTCNPNGTTTVAAASGQSFYNIPVCQGDYVSGTGVTAGTTVTAVSNSGSITVSSAITSGSNIVLTFTCGQSTDYAASLLFNANANLNQMLDTLIVELKLLEALGIPVILRPYPECNSSSFWWGYGSNRKCYWLARLFAYTVGYITGVHVFSGQPVSATPCHNVLFNYNIDAVAGVTQEKMPTINGTRYADIISGDFYTNATVTSMLSTMAAITGYDDTQCIQGVAELFGGLAAGASAIGGFMDPSMAGKDLSTLNSITLANFTAGNILASGTLRVPTTKGLQPVAFSSYNTGTKPLQIGNTGDGCTIDVSGVAAGSLILPYGLVAQTDAITNVGASALLTDIKTATTGGGNASFYCHWFEGDSQLYFPSIATLQADAWVINREQITPPMPWAAPEFQSVPQAPAGHGPRGLAHISARSADW
jgi:hypothetical protein